MSNKLEVDIRMFLFVALGANEYLHEDIQQMYQQNELEYYRVYKESVYFNCPLFMRYMTKKSEKMKQLVGIIQYEDEQGKDEKLLKLIKKGFKFSYQFVSQRTVVDIAELLYRFIQKRGGVAKVPEADIFYHGIVGMFLCTKFGKKQRVSSPIDEFMSKGFRESLFNSALIYMGGYPDEAFEPFQKEIDALKERFFYTKQEEITLDMFFDRMISKKELALIEQYYPDPDDYDEVRRLAFKTGILKYIGAYAGFLKVLGIDEVDITMQILTSREYETVFLQSLNAKRDNGLKSQEELDQYIIACLVLLVVVKEYKRTQNEYFDTEKNRLYDEVLHLKKELENEKVQLNKESQQLQSEIQQLKMENMRFRISAEKAEKEKNHLQKTLTEREENKKELLALREFAFRMKQDDETEEPVDSNEFEKQLEFLKGKKGAIFGGKANWQHKLKQYLPTFTFISPDSKGVDFSFVDKMDAVFINTTYNNHVIYNKLMSRLNKCDTPLNYLPNSTNAEILVQFIYQMLKK